MNKPAYPRRALEFYQRIPKVELHRHLEGSLRFSTMLEIARKFGLTVPNTGILRSMVQINETEPYTVRNFMSKFETLRLFYRSPEIIQRITREAILDAAADNVRYMELRFTPRALTKAMGFSIADVMDWVLTSTRAAQDETNIQVRMIPSINRHEDVKIAEEVIRLAIDRIKDGIVGIDLAGNEADFSAQPFANIFREAEQAGLRIVIHAGEWSGPDNVRDAILYFHAERIGHGVRVMEDSGVVDLARECGTAFEVCITSNYQSGVVPALAEHPMQRMLTAGLNVTINTDDPSISQIRLSDEYRLACEDLGLPLDVLKDRILAAAKAAFLPDIERQNLVKQFELEFRELGWS